MNTLRKLLLLAGIAFLASPLFASVFIPNNSEATITVTLSWEQVIHVNYTDPYGNPTGCDDYSICGEQEVLVSPGGAYYEDVNGVDSGAFLDEYYNIIGYWESSWVIVYS